MRTVTLNVGVAKKNSGMDPVEMIANWSIRRCHVVLSARYVHSGVTNVVNRGVMDCISPICFPVNFRRREYTTLLDSSA